MPIPSIPCLECELLKEEEIAAIRQYEDAGNALDAAFAALGPREIFDKVGLERWSAVTAEVEVSRERLQRARRKASEHRSTHLRPE